MRFDTKILTCALLLAMAVACNDNSKARSAATTAPTDSKKAEPARANSPATAAAKSADSIAPPPQMVRAVPDPLRGKVLETLNAGGYTYVLLSAEQGDVWAAARQFTVNEGDEVEVAGMSLMRDFHSPTLKRTFKEIQFAGRARLVADIPPTDSAHLNSAAPKNAMPPGHPPIDMPTAVTMPKPTPAVEVSQVEPLADGVTVASLWKQKSELAGKTVRFRGRAVKANSGILGVNWLHVQDGTGEPGSNDITVTSPTDFAAPGAIVVVEGTVAIDKDFGSGYAYDVIVENATVAVESP